jgi:hypothetical protein
MTIADFEKAKAIQHRLGVINENLIALREIDYDMYSHPLQQNSYKLKVDGSSSLEMFVDPDFIEMAIKYYEQEIVALNEQFDALGKENSNGISI